MFTTNPKKNLAWDNVYLKSDFLRLKPANMKAGAAKVIPLNNELTELFKNIIKCVHHNHVFTRNIREIFTKACKKAGVADLKYGSEGH